MSRPPELFPLFGGLEVLDGIGPKGAQALTRAGIERPRDLLLTLPNAVVDRRPVATIRTVTPPKVCTVVVEVMRHIPPVGRGRPARVIVRDAETEFTLIFFRAHGDWLQRQLPVGARRLVSGKLEHFDGQAQMPHPDFIGPAEGADLPLFEPIYPLTEGITQKVMTKAAASARSLLPDVAEWIDPALCAQKGWPGFAEALAAAHGPQGLADVLPTAPARERLAYDELFAHQVTLALARARQRKAPGRVTRGDERLTSRVLEALPFRPTGAQTRAAAEIAGDMAAPHRMNRLLQGDVGSGKTLVAMLALLTAVEAGGQGVLMAPTEILARQHMEGLAPLAADAGVRLDILTGRDKGAARAAKLADLASGAIQILVGTHAVFQKDVAFDDLRLAIIDEQHRFGVAQRMELGQKGAATDVLVMTATPIPRSLALAQYGDMELSVLDEKPPGRSPVTTAVLPTERLPAVLDRLRAAVAEGRQCYWVCPLVEDSELSPLTSAESRFKSLRAALGDGVVELVHGQMPPADKDAAMARFVSGAARVLCATTVIEVGVNVPNASIMVIEGADSFGLAQLHQLRGRVGRGSAQSTCVLLYDPPLSDSGHRRLDILRQTEDGFRIAEEDLALRGAGDVIGTAQSGLPQFRIADLDRQSALLALAQTDARKLLTDDPTLDSARGRATRLLLWLTDQDRALKLLEVG